MTGIQRDPGAREWALAHGVLDAALAPDSEEADDALRAADLFARAAQECAAARGRFAVALSGGETVLGPGPLWRERGRYASRVVVKSIEIGKTMESVRALDERYGSRFAARGARLVIDVEPQWL